MRGRIKRVAPVVAVLIVVIVFGATVYIARGGRVWASSRGVPSPVAVVCPGPEYTAYGRSYSTIGLPTIQPRNTCTSSFTEQDVRAYVSHNPHRLFGGIVVEGTPTVTSITFTTIRDLSRISGDSEFAANYPAEMVVCVVELKGTFIGDGPLFSNTTTAPKPSSLAYSLLDAHTGNELMEGLGGSPLK